MFVNVTTKWKEKLLLRLLLLSFFSIYLGWVSCFYFCKITLFFTGHAPLIIKIFNNKSDIILLISCFFSLKRFYLEFHCWFLQHLRPHLSFIVLFLLLSYQSWMVITTLFQIMSRECRPLKSDWNYQWLYIFTRNTFVVEWWTKMERRFYGFSIFFTRKKQFLWCGNRLLWNRSF